MAMPPSSSNDSFTAFDALLTEHEKRSVWPWSAGGYITDLDLFRDLLTIPVSQGDSQESGRPAKAFDAWAAATPPASARRRFWPT